MLRTERKKCTAETPSDGTPYDWCPPDAKQIDSYDSCEEGESYDKFKCPHCGITFKTYVSK